VKGCAVSKPLKQERREGKEVAEGRDEKMENETHSEKTNVPTVPFSNLSVQAPVSSTACPRIEGPSSQKTRTMLPKRWRRRSTLEREGS
jgi:hypothetical protein